MSFGIVSRMPASTPRILVAGAILIVHVLLARGLRIDLDVSHSLSRGPAIAWQLLDEVTLTREVDTLVTTPIRFEDASVTISPPSVTLDSAVPGDVEASGYEFVRVPFRAPRLLTTQPAVLQDLSVRAQQIAADTPTVLLAIDVGIDGRAARTLVEQSSGNAAIDALAVQYASSLRWEPGIIRDRVAEVRVRYPIRFSVAS